MKIKNCEGKELYTNSKLLVDGVIDIYKKYNFSDPGLGYDVYNIEAEACGQDLIYFEDSSPQTSQKEFIIKTKDDLDKLKGLQMSKDGRMPFVINALKIYQKQYGSTPPLQFCAPFSLAVAIYGYEKLVTDMYMKPDFIHKLMKTITEEVLIPWINHQKSVIPNWKVALGADALASPPNLTLDLLEEFVVPYILKLKNECGNSVGVVNWWGESYVKDIDRFLALKHKVSPDKSILRVQDPDLEDTNLKFIADFASSKNMSLTFGIGAKILSNGAVEDINRRVKNYIKKGNEVENFTLYLCNISKDTPAKNIHEAVNTARKLINAK